MKSIALCARSPNRLY